MATPIPDTADDIEITARTHSLSVSFQEGGPSSNGQLTPPRQLPRSSSDNDMTTTSTDPAPLPPSECAPEQQGGHPPEEKKSLLKTFGKAIGLDITNITIPVSYCEPISFLQKTCEALRFSELLDKASETDDSARRLMYISAFAITVYASTERPYKPFNPILGETFEHVTDKMKFIAEQVSHHPPISVSHAENENWVFWQETHVKTKFKGNSIDVFPAGRARVFLKKRNELYSWPAVLTIVHNVIMGQMWVENVGETEVKNHTSGEKAAIKFSQCGWLSSKGKYEVVGQIKDASEKTRLTLKGKWNDTLNGPDNEVLWKNDTTKENKYGFSKFTMQLNVMSPSMALPPTDSRVRPDRIALEKGDKKGAASEKVKLEEKQRAERRTRETRGEQWEPRYFKKVTGPEGEEFWDLRPGTSYWADREARIAQNKTKTSPEPSKDS